MRGIKFPAPRDTHIMLDGHSSTHAAVTTAQQCTINTIFAQRLDKARERIDAVCAEYNYFNPSCFVAESSSSTILCAEAERENRFHSPSPGQLMTDLQALFERFLALESDAADNAYRRISLHAWETASDEYGAFDWEKLKEIIRDEVREMDELGCYVNVSDLVTLRTMSSCS